MLDRPHRRWNSLTGEWVSVSPQRSQRPWQGRVEAVPAAALAEHDPHCYLCPGNLRANGERNPRYESTYAFTNDFPAFVPEPAGTPEPAAGDAGVGEHALLQARTQAGTCRVLCFSPRHDLTLAHLSAAQTRAVVDLWAQETEALARRWRWVQLFENKGEIMGCSNPHPHGQAWASDFLPSEPARELRQQREWFGQHDSPLLLDYAALEAAEGER